MGQDDPTQAAKFVAFAFTGSASMLAEALRSTADAGNQSLMLLGERRSRQRPTPAHPFGFGSERYFWGFVVAAVLFALASLFSLVEGEEKLRRPRPVESTGWAIAVLLFGGVLLGVIALFLATEMRSLLVGESASERRQQQLREAVVSVPGVQGVSRMNTLQIGPEDILVEADAEVESGLTVDDAHNIEADAETKIRHDVPTATHIVVRAVPAETPDDDEADPP